MNDVVLDESEITAGRAITATIRALEQNLAALAMSEQLYIDSLRKRRGLGEEWQILFWEKGFEWQPKQSTTCPS